MFLFEVYLQKNRMKQSNGNNNIAKLFLWLLVNHIDEWCIANCDPYKVKDLDEGSNLFIYSILPPPHSLTLLFILLCFLHLISENGSKMCFLKRLYPR